MGIVLPRRASILDIYIYIFPFLSESWYRDSTLYAKIQQQFISREEVGGLLHYIFLVSTSGEITFSGHE